MLLPRSAWKAARPLTGGLSVTNRWRTILIIGVALLAAVLVIINVPPYNNRELPEAGWLLMMLSLVTSVGLIKVGLTMGIARRSNHHTPPPNDRHDHNVTATAATDTVPPGPRRRGSSSLALCDGEPSDAVAGFWSSCLR